MLNSTQLNYSWIDNKKEFSFLESTIFLHNIFLVITSTEIDAFDFFVYLLTQKNRKMSTLKLATNALHAGHDVTTNGGTRAVPIYQTTSYVFNNSEHAANLFSLKELGFITL